jgi:hypothetical protein
MFAASAALRVAYEATAYVVCWRGQAAVLRIGGRPPPLPWGACGQAVFVTACNPLGRLRPAASNRRAERLLRVELARAGWRMLAGEGRANAGDWPTEASVLVFGMRRLGAAALGRRWRQNAVVRIVRFGRIGVVPLR